MLKSCNKCGRIHDAKFKCKSDRRSKKKNTENDKFRSSYEWKLKREEIKERDLFVCQICKLKIHNYKREFETEDISVHHIESLEEDFEKRLDDDNLITLCRYHHELAEKGIIKKIFLKNILK